MAADPAAPATDGVFTVGRRGYDPHQVDAHLRRMDAEIRILVADRDAAVDQTVQLGRDLDEARLRADRLRTQVRIMAGRPSDVQGMSERMRTMLRLAEDEVADMLRRAEAEVAARIGEAEATAGKLRDAAQQEAAQLHDAAQADADRTTAAAARHREESEAACEAQRQAVAAECAAAERASAEAAAESERLRSHVWAESEGRRAQVEEDFHIAMDQRRAEAMAEMQAEHARTAAWVQHSRDETTRQCRAELAAAEYTAHGIVVAAREHAAELADLRGRIAIQLHGTHEQLAGALTALAPGNEPPSAVVAVPVVAAPPHVPPAVPPVAPAAVTPPPGAPPAVAPPPARPVAAAEPVTALPASHTAAALPAPGDHPGGRTGAEPADGEPATHPLLTTTSAPPSDPTGDPTGDPAGDTAVVDAPTPPTPSSPPTPQSAQPDTPHVEASAPAPSEAPSEAPTGPSDDGSTERTVPIEPAAIPAARPGSDRQASHDEQDRRPPRRRTRRSATEITRR